MTIEHLFSAPGLASLGPVRRPTSWPMDRLEDAVAQVTQALSAQRRSLVTGLALFWHDHLDASHEIAQAIESADGSLLHAMMHRREPDPSNAKYWFRRVGHHPSFVALATKAAEVLESHQALAALLLPSGRWDPYQFVEQCSAVQQGKNEKAETVLQKIQELEVLAFLNYLVE